MKHTAFSNYQKGNWSLLLLPMVAATIFSAVPTPSYAAPAAHPKAAKAVSSLPAAALPYTFKCPHCGLNITIKSPADWNKDCMTCACGKSNLGCYRDIKK